ncbi:MAG: hypothetical protein H6868_07410 [Rhodospirillales bacterium]|nr:hypothetical protein [Rhodospirillales bacterium]
MSSLLDSGQYTLGLLSVGRGNAPRGAPGLSASSRALINDFLSSSSTNSNTLFANTTTGAYSVEELQTVIKGLRASLPERMVLPSLLGQEVDTEA